MIKGQLAAFSMMFNDNGIKLIDRIPDGLTVHSDERTILLVLQNFLSNAVSNIGGKKIVQLTVEDNLNTYRVSVYNSGDPIAEDELDKYGTASTNPQRSARTRIFISGSVCR